MWASKLNTQENRWCSSSPKASRQTQESAGAELVQRQSAGELPLGQKGQSFYSIQAFKSLDEAHSHYGEQSGYSQFTDLNVNLLQNDSPS